MKHETSKEYKYPDSLRAFFKNTFRKRIERIALSLGIMHIRHYVDFSTCYIYNQ